MEFATGRLLQFSIADGAWHMAADDLMLGATKILGSAQRRQRGASLQHGGLLLAQSTATPSLPGIEEITGVRLELRRVADAVVNAFRVEAGWPLQELEWSATELARID